MTHPNEETLRKAGEALSQGDMEGFLAHHTEDSVVHAPGRSSLAGDHRGKDGIAQLFARQAQMADGPPQVETHDILANDTHGVVLNKMKAQSGGRTLDTEQTVVCHFRDGKISEVWVHFGDQYALDELMS